MASRRRYSLITKKGIRECGLDFIVRTADYYGVSCDYLLGKTPHRQGEKLHVPETEEEDTHDGLPQREPKNNIELLTYCIWYSEKINSKSLTKEITLYLSGAVYNAFRMLYTANPKNPSALFETKDGLSEALTDGRMQLARAKSRVMLLGEKVSDDEAVRKKDLPQLSGEMLSAEYPDWAPSLFALIENTENEHKEN